MKRAQTIGRELFAAMTCLTLVIWSVSPSFTHAPIVFETIQDHLEMVEDHGHSHGFEEDFQWAMHGHSHDVADHDHNQAFLSAGQRGEPVATFSEALLSMGSSSGPSRHFRIDRPPRA
ncbi:hypothetical protein [Sulfitobacter mediterraneus]|uniref:hypothetical protein n=1 Tax=Sulfitobacter mediterraneus TaxID=83219 RepID=UPI0024905102|nr:hypothetical protein [Sulfitobacter mediterraneus]